MTALNIQLAAVLSFLASYKKSFKENGLEIRDLFISFVFSWTFVDACSREICLH